MYEIISVSNVVKRIKRKQVLNGVNMTVYRGDVYVLAGPNGAGKTTFIRILMGLIRRDGGEIQVLGVDPQTREWESVKTRIGYLPEDASPYDRLTGWENLLFHAMLYTRGDKDLAWKYAEKGAEISGLAPEDLERRAGGYSRGMKRRLLIAATLMHEPDLVVMDEPTSGLDVFAAYRVKKMIKELSSRGYTFLITTHDMAEAQELASRIGFINKGITMFEGTVEEALSMFNAETLEEAFVRAVSNGGS